MNFFRSYMQHGNTRKVCDIMDKWHAQLEKEGLETLEALHLAEIKYGYVQELSDHFTIPVFIKFSVMDIFLLYKMLFKSEDDNERNLMARTLATHIAEFIDDVGGLVGKPLGNLIKGHESNQRLNQQLKNVRIYFQSIKNKYDGLKEIRNVVSSHKDKNVIRQLAVKEKMNLDQLHLLIIFNFQKFIGTFIFFERNLGHIMAFKRTSLSKQNAD